jgi:23S rRNA pseudouridine2604 synthase
MQQISLNKFISDSGYCSRREADILIAAGRVMVNDLVADLAMKVYADDIVAVDFEVIKAKKKEDTIILAYNKPVGLTCTMDLEDKTSMMHFIKYPKRIFPIGRLDKDSEGLILLSNDGDIVNKILRSENNHEKEYWVGLNKAFDKKFLTAMSSGVKIDAGTTKPCKIKPISPRRFSITLTEGMNRQIRKMCKALDYKVESLQRVRIMNIYIGQMGAGKFRRINTVEQEQLLSTISTSTNKPSRKKKIQTPVAPQPKVFGSAAKYSSEQHNDDEKPLRLQPRKASVQKAIERKAAKTPKEGSYKAFKRKG